ncbi:MAG TPA: GDSL-type esterase/lipase family protein [Candidatus Eisenbacteria bacterium]|nr:GDSL-type esterase/lipase family protein [Candidatus Eisenbacteria bacterium]
MTPGFRRYAGVLALAACSGLIAAGGAFGRERDCAVPDRFYTFEPPLTRTIKALLSNREVVIVALGGASTVGRAAGGLDLAWPARLGAALADRIPSARVKVVNLAVARQTVREGVDRLARDVLPLKPTLVIWETGTMEAVRGSDVDEFREALQAGITQLHAARTEAALMDMQFSRDTDAMIRFEPYLAAMEQVADANEVPLFRRHAIMRYWAESGSLDFRVRDGEKRRQLAAKLYDCIGRAMADFVTRGLPAAKPPASRGDR